jgi:mono/diheme cytochrome c family protein
VSDSGDVIRLYIDDDKEPFKTAKPPIRFQFSTLHLADGPHRLRVEAHNGLAGDAVREIPFHVRNGVAITVTGIDAGQEVAGQVGVVINAWAGNQEIDFEPSRAETPQPIPTWAWLIFLVIVAWTMFYVLSPGSGPDAVAATAASDARVGDRVYADACAKCHLEDGRGLPEIGPKPLRAPGKNRPWSDEVLLSEDPTELIKTIVAGLPPQMAPKLTMPAWGVRLTTDELVAVVNKVRSSWGNQAPLLLEGSKRPPAAIRELEDRYRDALQLPSLTEVASLPEKERRQKVRKALEDVFTPAPSAARLTRPASGSDAHVDVEDRRAVVDTLENWLATLNSVNSVTPIEATWIELPGGRVVVAHGGVLLNVSRKDGGPSDLTGRFLRVYRKEKFTVASVDNKGNPCEVDEERWVVAFDFATWPMPIGCDEPIVDAEGKFECSEAEARSMDYAKVQAIFRKLGQQAPHAPHGNFWELPYEEFKRLEFPYRLRDGRVGKIRLVNASVVAHATNLVKALQDGRDIVVEVEGSPEPVREDVERMPKGARPVSSQDLARIVAWIRRGMPEKVAPTDGDGEPGATDGPRPPVDAGDWREGDLDFAGVVKVLADLNQKASGSPHGRFWTKSYADFLAFEFTTASGEKVRLVKPGDGAGSNLVRALLGEPLEGTVDGKPVVVPGKPMPPKGAKPTPEQIEQIRRWIDRGAPEKRPEGPGGAPPSPPAEPAAPGTPPPTPAPPAPTPPPAPAGGWEEGDLDFAGVVKVLADLNQKASGSPHGRFWTKSYADFLALEFTTASGEKVRLLNPGDGAGSNLVRALKGEALEGTVDGKPVVVPGKLMPPKGAKPTPEQIERIRRWIDRGAPEKRPP